MFRGFLAKVGKITPRLPSVSMVKTTNQKKILHNCFQATFVTIKQPGTNTELIGGHLLRKTSVPFYSIYNTAGARCRCNLFQAIGGMT